LDEIRLLLEEHRIQRTLDLYGHAIDYGDSDTWVACFTEDGVFEGHPRVEGARTFRIAGREALLAFARDHTRPPHAWHKHLVLHPRIRVQGRRADVLSYFVLAAERGGAPVIRMFGRYHDELVLEDDGMWRFEHRLAEVESIAEGMSPMSLSALAVESR
jgi:hypothetical protein